MPSRGCSSASLSSAASWLCWRSLIAGFIAWIGALLNTWQLESKAWFVALVLPGIFNFGFIAMIVFLAAGPDGTTDARLRRRRPHDDTA